MHLIFALIVSLLLYLIPAQARPAAMSASTEADPDAFVVQCVNVINGDFCRSVLDIAIQGPDTLALARYYSNRNYLTGSGAGGWRMLSDLFLVMGREKSPDAAPPHERARMRFYAFTGGRSGGIFAYSSESTDAGIIDGPMKIDMERDGAGLCNTYAREISGKNNHRNDRLHINDRGCELILGDGTVCIYDKTSTPPASFFGGDLISSMTAEVAQPHYYRLVEEKLPSGNIISFSYDTLGRLSRMLMSDQTRAKPFSWINFSYDVAESTCRVNVDTSDSRTLTYHFTALNPGKSTPQYALTHVEGSHTIPCSYEYERRDNLSLLSRESYPQGRCLSVSYDEAGKVKTLSEPSFDAQANIVTHTFSYDTLATDVRNAGNVKTRFQYDEHERLTHVEKYDCNDVLQRTDQKLWDKKTGRITAKFVTDGESHVYAYQSFNYDANANVIKEKLYGNLTGKGKLPQLDAQNKLLKGHGEECYVKHFVYSDDGLNLLLKSIDGHGTEVFYHYAPGTNRLEKQFLRSKGTIERRTFYAYNADGVCIETIEDDGHSEDKENISCVSERHITSVLPKIDFPGIGLPTTIEERALDVETGKAILIGKTMNVFDDQGHIIASERYDDQSAFAYRETATYNPLGKIISTTDKVGNTSRYTYDQLGNRTSACNEWEGKTTRYYHDGCGRLVKSEVITSDLTQSAHTAYDLLGRIVASTDCFGNTTSYEYDDFDRLIEMKQPKMVNEEGQVLVPTFHYEYDIFGNMTCLTDPKGYATSKQYTLRGNPHRISHPDGTHETFRYNTDGSLHFSKRRYGITTKYEYDYLGRVIHEAILNEAEEKGDDVAMEPKKIEYSGFHRISESTGASKIEYSYDATGRCRIITESRLDDQGSLRQLQRKTFLYDSLGRMIQEGVEYPSSGESTHRHYTLDLAGNVLRNRLVDHAGTVLVDKLAVYDASDQRVEEYSLEGGTEKLVCATAYNSLGEPISYTDGEGNIVRIELDYGHRNALGQRVLKQRTIDPVEGNMEIEFDAFGRIVLVEEKADSGELLAYRKMAYDMVGNATEETICNTLKDASPTSTTTRFRYGPMGRLDEEIHNYGTASERIVQYPCDGSGQLIAKGKHHSHHKENHKEPRKEELELFKKICPQHRVPLSDHNCLWEMERRELCPRDPSSANPTRSEESHRLLRGECPLCGRSIANCAWELQRRASGGPGTDEIHVMFSDPMGVCTMYCFDEFETVCCRGGLSNIYDLNSMKQNKKIKDSIKAKIGDNLIEYANLQVCFINGILNDLEGAGKLHEERIDK